MVIGTARDRAACNSDMLGQQRVLSSRSFGKESTYIAELKYTVESCVHPL
jgi:hypothetical protein